MKPFKKCKCGTFCSSGYCQNCRDKDQREKDIKKLMRKNEVIILDSNEFKKLWAGNTNALYYSKDTAKILDVLNNVINGMHYIGGENAYIIHTLNTTTYVEEECKKLLDSIGTDLCEIANKFEMVRSLLFGDCFNWNYILDNIRDIPSKGDAKKDEEEMP